LVSSFSRPILENIIEIDRDLAVGVLTEWHEEGDFLSLCKSFKAFSWHPYYKSFNKKDILKMHKAGIKVIPYTVNSEDEIAELIKMGIDGLFTDDPLTALKARDLSY
jgi:glycerophosphoryl diester phosphodiesterase